MTSACCWKLPANNWLLTKSAAGDRYIKRVVKAIGEKPRAAPRRDAARRGVAWCGVACDPLDLQSRRWTAVHFIPFIRVKMMLMRKIGATSVSFKPQPQFNRFLVRASTTDEINTIGEMEMFLETPRKDIVEISLAFYAGSVTAWICWRERETTMNSNIIRVRAKISTVYRISATRK